MLSIACGDPAGPIDPRLDPIAVVQVDVSPLVDTIFAADTIRSTDQLQLTAVIQGRAGPITGGSAIWMSEDSSVATVSQTGMVRPRRFGSVRIVASASKRGYASVVVASAVTRVTISPSTDTILVRDPIVFSDTIRLAATATDAARAPVTGTRLVWTSSNPAVAVVDSTGFVRALSVGRTTIMSASPSAGVQGAATLVVAPRVRRVEVAPALDTIFVEDPIIAADTQRFAARLLDESGAPVTGTRLTWASSNPNVASVDAAGLVRALSLGTATLTARSSEVSGEGQVIIAPSIKSITVTSPVSQAVALDTIQLSATAFNYADQRVSGRAFSWQSSNNAVATVDSAGRVISVGPGTATFTARSAFRSSAVSISFAERRLLSVDAGGDFSCGTTALGRLYCWGRGDIGQLATLSDSSCFDETVTELPDGTLITQQLGTRSGCSLAPKRSAGPTLNFRVAAAGGNFGCGLTIDRLIYCWGNDLDGQIGNGSSPGGGPQPRLATVGSIRFDSISVGNRHACAISTTGSAYCWGNDSLGQLGDRRTVNSTTPIPVAGGHTFKSISAGGAHTCGIRADGVAMCWGANGRGQLGNATSGRFVDQPTTVVLGGTYASISAGYAHTCAITTDGRAFCWGDNTRGQLGVGSAADFMTTPTAVSGGLTFSRIAAGGYNDTLTVLLTKRDSLDVLVLSRGIRSSTCALTLAGAAYCWGDNYWRQVGLNDAPGDKVSTPNAVPVSASGGFVSISVGSRHVCAYGVNGQAWCWGSNVFGALGNELQAAGRSEPQLVVRPR